MLYRYDIIIEVGAYNAAATALTRQSGAICCPLLIIYIIYLVFIFIRIYMGNRERILKREPTAVAPPSSTSLMNNGQVTYETNEHEKGEKKYKGREKKRVFRSLYSLPRWLPTTFFYCFDFLKCLFTFSLVCLLPSSLLKDCDVIQFEHEHLFLLSFLMLSSTTHNSNCIHKRRVKSKKEIKC